MGPTLYIGNQIYTASQIADMDMMLTMLSAGKQSLHSLLFISIIADITF